MPFKASEGKTKPNISKAQAPINAQIASLILKGRTIIVMKVSKEIAQMLAWSMYNQR
jgi:hypothetical protein